MQSEMDAHRGVLSGTLTIGSGPYPAAIILEPTLKEFCQRYPNIQLDININDSPTFPEKLLTKDYDLAVIDTSQLENPQNFDLIPLDRHQGFFFCRKHHPIWKKHAITGKDISPFPLISIIPPKRAMSLLDRMFSSGSVLDAPQIKHKNIHCNNLALNNAMILNSDAIGIGSYSSLRAELESGQVRPIPLRYPWLVTWYDIVTRHGSSLSPSAQAFIEILMRVDKQQSMLETDLVRALGPVIEG